MVWEVEVGDGVVVADVSDEVAEEDGIIWEFSVFDILADDVAEQAAEVFVTREGKEGAGIGEHADEVREETDGGEGIDLIFHAFEGVIEPPSGAELDLAAVWSFLERATGSGEDGVVPRVKVVDDRFWKFVDLGERVEEGKDGFALWPIADGVESGVRAELIKEAGVGVSLGAEVELHRPVLFGGPCSNVNHNKGSEGIGLFSCCGVSLAGVV